jgi:hypothetical protein
MIRIRSDHRRGLPIRVVGGSGGSGSGYILFVAVFIIRILHFRLAILLALGGARREASSRDRRLGCVKVI